MSEGEISEAYIQGMLEILEEYGLEVPKPHGFMVGDEVRKPDGYPFDSTVVAVFEKLNGETRVVCESHAIPGLLHVFALNQIMKL